MYAYSQSSGITRQKYGEHAIERLAVRKDHRLLLVRGAMEQLWSGVYVLYLEGLNIQRNTLLASSHGEAWRCELGRRRVTPRTLAIHHTTLMKANLLLDFQESWERRQLHSTS